MSDNATASQQDGRATFANYETIIEKQRALGKRLVWLFLVPFLITAALVAMFFVLSARLTDVEIGTKLAAIERILLSDKNYAWAVDQYEQIAKTNERAPILARLGILYFLLDPKNESTAIQKLEMARRLDPGYWEVYRSLTYIYAITGQTKNAIENGRKALQLSSYDANTYNNLAWSYATSKDPALRNLELAQQYAERAIALTKEKQPYFIDTLAEVYVQKGGADDRDLARKWLRKAIALAPSGEVQIFHDRFRTLFPDEKP